MGSLSPEVMLQSLREVGSVVLAIILFTAALEAALYGIFVKTLKHKYAQPIMLLAPAAIGISLLVVYPIAYEFRLAFSNMSLDNFKRSYNLTDDSLVQLAETGVPEDVLMEFKGVTEQEFSSEEDLLSELEESLGTENVAPYKEAFIEAAQKKDGKLKLTKRSQFTLKKTLPEALMTNLREQKGMLNTQYSSQSNFLNDIEKTIGKEDFERYKEGFLQYALANPGPSFGLQEGLKNFKEIFTQPILKQIHFLQLFGQTMLWTIIQVTSHVVLGLGLAMLMNRPIKFRGLYRTLIIVPWAIPQVIAVLAWRGEFHYEYGFLNLMLTRMGFEAIQWKVNPLWNFVAMNITNIWLGVPFMMVILLGGLQSIPETYYEAANVDGANKWEKFRHITLPLIQPVMTPAVILGVIWTFNNFNVPFLINAEYELETSDILVTALFRSAFEYSRYGFAAAFSLVIFAILLIFCIVYMRIVKLDLGLGGKKKKAV